MLIKPQSNVSHYLKWNTCGILSRISCKQSQEETKWMSNMYVQPDCSWSQGLKHLQFTCLVPQSKPEEAVKTMTVPETKDMWTSSATICKKTREMLINHTAAGFRIRL
ncbi:hypothetical protein KC19_6G154000 [Ceratodon purpureus]|uniref:Uncharacterized protein n=1 Tax=Ceratodon purpureus TaxID=3225 RepID=A0A8T0HEX8_CERPU|nr:hypothetical protein KC19_6G154000 [Ceratodon purpureus]